jgi:hypothetical protein
MRAGHTCQGRSKCGPLAPVEKWSTFGSAAAGRVRWAVWGPIGESWRWRRETGRWERFCGPRRGRCGRALSVQAFIDAAYRSIEDGGPVHLETPELYPT